MNATERRAVFALGSIFLLRMLGLFLLLPVMSIYVAEFESASPMYAGLALGIYGFTQALFQIPYGMASDRFGRKPVIALGLLVFLLGSVIAALSDSLVWLVVGRALQGAGAISSAVLALTADLTRAQQRTKSMAVIGISIGFAFLLSLVLAPLLQKSIGISGIFWMIAVLALFAIVVLYRVVPDPNPEFRHQDILPIPQQFADALKDHQLLRMNFGIFALHFILTALFVVIPVVLVEQGEIPLSEHWRGYLVIILLSVVGMAPLIRIGSRPGLEIYVFRVAIGVLLLSMVGLFYSSEFAVYWLFGSLVVFFTGFNALESMTPALVSRIAPAKTKGTAMGIYHSCQFFGMFVGGVSAGALASYFGSSGVYVLCGGVALSWLGISFIGPKPKLLIHKIISIDGVSLSQQAQVIDRISAINGVHKVVTEQTHNTAYLSVDPAAFDEIEFDAVISDLSEHKYEQ